MPALGLRDYQAVAVAKLANVTQGTVVIPCGGGKTRVGMGAISKLRTPTLILVHTLDLAEQWLGELKDKLGLDAGLIGDGEERTAPVTVAVIQALRAEAHPALRGGRAAAKFLTGLTSPATLREKLTRHESFGRLAHVPFAEVLSTLAGWMDALGKAPIVLPRQVPGFVVNRLQYALLREAFALVDQGVCSYEDVDRVLTRGLGVRWAAVGPFQTIDLGGVDVFATVARNLLPELSNAVEPPAFLDEATARGELGTKSGRGLLGDYAPEEIDAIATRRERVARAVAKARDGEAR